MCLRIGLLADIHATAGKDLVATHAIIGGRDQLGRVILAPRSLSERHIDLIVATSGDDREIDSILQQAGVDDLIPSRTTKNDAPARQSPIRTSCTPRLRAPGRGQSRSC